MTNCVNLSSISTIKLKQKQKGIIIKFNEIVGYNFNSSFYRNLKFVSPITAKAQTNNTLNDLSLPINNNNNNNNNNYSVYITETNKLLTLIFKSMYCLIGKPVFKFSPDKLQIEIFYYLTIPRKKIFKLFSIINIPSFKKKWVNNMQRQKPSLNLERQGNKNPNNRLNKVRPLFIRWKLRKSISRFKSKHNLIKNLLFNIRKCQIVKVFNSKFKIIIDIISNIFNKPVELIITRLHSPYYDSNILVNLLSLNIKNKRKKSRVAILKIYSNNKKKVKLLNDPNNNSKLGIPAFLSGMNIKINGRLMREPNIPRLTTKVFENGAIATGKVNYLDTANLTRKNKKGAYNIKIANAINFY